VGILLLMGVGLSGSWHLALWQSGSLTEITDALSVLGLPSWNGEAARNQQQAVGWLALAAVSAAPLLLLLVSGVIALAQRIPVSVGLVRGLHAAVLPLACLLLLLWGGLLLGTVRQEGVVNAQVRHTVHDEGPYLAAQAGQTWPGPVR